MSCRRPSQKKSSSRGRPAVPPPQDQDVDPQGRKSNCTDSQANEEIQAKTEKTTPNLVDATKGYIYRFIDYSKGLLQSWTGKASSPSTENDVDLEEDAPGSSGFVGFNHKMKPKKTPVRSSLMEIQDNQENGRASRTPRHQVPKRARQAPGFPSDENTTPPQVKRQRRERSHESDEGEQMEIEERGPEVDNLQPQKIEMKRCREGEQYQVDIQPLLTTDPTIEYDEDEEREHLTWVSQDSGTQNDLEKKKEEEKTHELIRNKYFRAIWRQFGGHILFEEALQHLKDNGYDVPVSLDTIDQLLQTKPLVIKHARVAQVVNLAKYGVDECVSLKKLQEKALPNFSLSQVTDYHFQYMKYYMFKDQWDDWCQCWDKLCKLEHFETRIGCVNCTKHRRTAIKGQGLCLICKTYKSLTKQTRPAANVIFTNQEEELLKKWEEKELIAGKRLSRVDFESMLKKEDEERLRKLELSNEEQDILNSLDRRTMAEYRRMNVKEKGDWLVKKLAPFKLPQIFYCYCNWTTAKEKLVKEQELFLVEYPEVNFRYNFKEHFNPWV